MSTFQAILTWWMTILTDICDWVSHPLATRTIPIPTPTRVVYETPLVWSREFLEQSGFNLTERIPALLGVYKIPGGVYYDNFAPKRATSAIPPELIHEVLLHWVLTFIEGVHNTLCGLDQYDVAWLVFLGLVMAMGYLHRFRLRNILSKVWKELDDDVAEFCHSQFFTSTQPRHRQFSTSTQTPPSPFVLPPGTVLLTTDDVRDLGHSADAIQRRIDSLESELEAKTENLEKVNSLLEDLHDLRETITTLQEELDEGAESTGVLYDDFEDGEDAASATVGETSSGEEDEEEIEQAGRSEDAVPPELPEENIPSPDTSSHNTPHSHTPYTSSPPPSHNSHTSPPQKPLSPLPSPSPATLEQPAAVTATGSASDSAPSTQPTPGEHTPAPKATGPEQVKNPHVQKLNREVKRLDWRRKSGMPDSEGEEDGVAPPSDVVDDMFDRQVAQPQSFPANRFARGSMFGALSDDEGPVQAATPSQGQEEDELKPTPVERVDGTAGENGTEEASKTPVNSSPDSAQESAVDEETEGDDDGKGEGEGWSDIDDDEDSQDGAKKGPHDDALMLGRYKVTRGPAQDDGAPMLGKHKVTRGDAPVVKDEGEGKNGDEEKAEDHKVVPEIKESKGGDEKGEDHKVVKEVKEGKGENKASDQDPQPPQINPAREEDLPKQATTTTTPPAAPQRRLRPSNFFAGEANVLAAPITHNERVGAELAKGLDSLPTRSLAASMWAPKSSRQQVPPSHPTPKEEGEGKNRDGEEGEDHKVVKEDKGGKGENKTSVQDPQTPQANPAPKEDLPKQAPTPTPPAAPQPPQRPRRPSNFFAGEANALAAPMTHNERMGELMAKAIDEIYGPQVYTPRRVPNQPDDNPRASGLPAGAGASQPRTADQPGVAPAGRFGIIGDGARSVARVPQYPVLNPTSPTPIPTGPRNPAAANGGRGRGRDGGARSSAIQDSVRRQEKAWKKQG